MSAGCTTLGIKNLVRQAIYDTVHVHPAHCFICPIGNIGKVNIVHTEHPQTLETAAVLLLIAVEDSGELFTGDSQFFLTDEGIIPLINGIAGEEVQFFLDLNELYPDAELHENCGFRVNTTNFTEAARWTSCPDSVGVYIRSEFIDSTSNTEQTALQRERALEVLHNIATNNIINPIEK